MTKPQTKIRNVTEYWLARAVAFGLNWLPSPLAKAICRVAADCWRLLDKRHREMAVGNGMARLGLDEASARRMVRENYRHYAYLALEFSRLLYLTLDDAQKTVDAAGLREKVVEGLAAGKGLVFLTGHLGNWEWASLVKEGHYPHTKGVIARPLRNPLLDKLICGMRERGGGKVWRKKGAIRKALGALREGRMIVAVVDQNGGRHGTMAPFLGKNASTMAAPVELAIRAGAPLLVGALIRSGDPGSFRIHIGDLIRPDPGADPEEEKIRLLTLVNRDLGEIIRRFPEQWIWIHNRWREYDKPFRDRRADGAGQAGNERTPPHPSNKENAMIEKKFEQLAVKIYPSRGEMGAAAAAEAAAFLRELQAEKDEINCVFASAPSQNEFLAALSAEKGIDWKRMNAFHMDEYIGLPSSDPRSFAAYLDRAIFSRVPFGSVNLMNGMADGAAECGRYAGLIAAHPIDVVFMGIGENGHIAFNDPPVADFEDPLTVKTVELERPCRQQQVNDGCFPNLDLVPKHALTLTIPALVNVKRKFCVVPGERKAAAVAAALAGPIAISCPASILRRSPGATMYLDADAASGIAP